MLHIYFKADGEVLFGTNDQTAFDPELSCPQVSATATSGATHAASSGATATPTATPTPTPTALAQTGGPSPMAVLAAGAAVGLLVASGLMAAILARRGQQYRRHRSDPTGS